MYDPSWLEVTGKDAIGVITRSGARVEVWPIERDFHSRGFWRVEPGTKFCSESHGYGHDFYVILGEGIVEVGGQTIIYHPGMHLSIGPRRVHRILRVIKKTLIYEEVW